MVVTRSEIISRVAKRFPDLYVEDVRASVDVILDSVRDALADGRRIELRGFGCFALRYRGARQGRDPRTGDAILVVEKYKPHFTPGKALQISLKRYAGGGRLGETGTPADDNDCQCETAAEAFA